MFLFFQDLGNMYGFVDNQHNSPVQMEDLEMQKQQLLSWAKKWMICRLMTVKEIHGGGPSCGTCRVFRYVQGQKQNSEKLDHRALIF